MATERRLGSREPHPPVAVAQKIAPDWTTKKGGMVPPSILQELRPSLYVLTETTRHLDYYNPGDRTAGT
jgi:hypothetical protein